MAHQGRTRAVGSGGVGTAVLTEAMLSLLHLFPPMG